MTSYIINHLQVEAVLKYVQHSQVSKEEVDLVESGNENFIVHRDLMVFKGSCSNDWIQFWTSFQAMSISWVPNCNIDSFEACNMSECWTPFRTQT